MGQLGSVHPGPSVPFAYTRIGVCEMRIGIVGATGQVGGVMLQVLEQRQVPIDELRLFASAR